MDSKAIHIPASTFDEALNTLPAQGKRSLEPLKTFSAVHKIPLEIIEDTAVTNRVELHKHTADLWQCLEGEVIFTVGGTLKDGKPKVRKDGSIDESEWRADEIEGGTEITLQKGDWLWIPAGEPHAHRASGTARLAIIKIPVS